MLLDKHERKYKRFIALQKEYNEILEAERKLPWTEVKPYQDGWFIHIEFRDEVKRRADYPHLKAALDAVHSLGRTKDPKLVNRLRSTKRIEQMYRLFTERSTYYQYLSEKYADSEYTSKPGTWNWRYSGSYPAVLARCSPVKYSNLHPSAQKWLYKTTDNTKYWGVREWYKSAIPEHFFKVKIRPTYVTHEKNIDPQLMRRKAEVNVEMDALGRDFWSKNGYESWFSHYVNRRRRVHDRASLRKVLKGEKEDFEYTRKNKHYD